METNRQTEQFGIFRFLIASLALMSHPAITAGNRQFGPQSLPHHYDCPPHPPPSQYPPALHTVLDLHPHCEDLQPPAEDEGVTSKLEEGVRPPTGTM